MCLILLRMIRFFWCTSRVMELIFAKPAHCCRVVRILESGTKFLPGLICLDTFARALSVVNRVCMTLLPHLHNFCSFSSEGFVLYSAANWRDSTPSPRMRWTRRIDHTTRLKMILMAWRDNGGKWKRETTRGMGENVLGKTVLRYVTLYLT